MQKMETRNGNLPESTRCLPQCESEDTFASSLRSDTDSAPDVQQHHQHDSPSADRSASLRPFLSVHHSSVSRVLGGCATRSNQYFSQADVSARSVYVSSAAFNSVDSPLRAAMWTSHEQLVGVFSDALMYLPLQDIDAARHVSPALAAAADRVAPQPLGEAAPVFVRWMPQALRTTLPPTRAQTMAMAQGLNVPAMFHWLCLACNRRTAGPRYCRECHTPMAVGACRLFMGQLRKELTAELAAAMLRTLLPDVEILHVESHTNGTDGHGRGCAWVFVGSVEDARRVTALHKRVFVNVDADGGEGFWFARDPALVPALDAMVAEAVARTDIPEGLPRLPVVVEAPGRSLIISRLRALRTVGS